MQNTIEKIHAVIAPSLEHMGYRIVQLKITDGSKARTLQLMAERTSDGSMSVDDCAEVSRTVSALLDVEDIIQGQYRLEVSSPGIDRPLVTMQDMEKYLGFDAKIETTLPISGRKRFKGTLLEAQDNNVTMQIDNERFEIPFDRISAAKLVLTDALLKAHQDGIWKKETQTA